MRCRVETGKPAGRQARASRLSGRSPMRPPEQRRLAMRTAIDLHGYCERITTLSGEAIVPRLRGLTSGGLSDRARPAIASVACVVAFNLQKYVGNLIQQQPCAFERGDPEVILSGVICPSRNVSSLALSVSGLLARPISTRGSRTGHQLFSTAEGWRNLPYREYRIYDIIRL